MNESPDTIHGRLNEGAHIAGYSLERALANFTWLLEDERWKKLSGDFDNVNDFLRSVEGAFSGFKLMADQRKSIVKLIKEQQPEASQRAIAGVVGAGVATVNRDVSDGTPKTLIQAKPRRSVVPNETPRYPKVSDPDPKWYQSSESPIWETPQWLFDLLDDEFSFDVDVCALPENAKCETFFSPEDDGLAQEWRGVCWMNPPYGDVIAEWMTKARQSAEAGATVVCLVPARTDTNWWWENCIQGEIRFIRGRLKWPGSATAATFPSAVIVLGPGIGRRVEWWDVQNR